MKLGVGYIVGVGAVLIMLFLSGCGPACQRRMDPIFSPSMDDRHDMVNCPGPERDHSMEYLSAQLQGL